ncbi:MAG: Xaa-Pro peptidase family protein [Nanoarchaeota archaeon]
MRLLELQKVMKEKGIGCCLFFGQDPAVRYFSDFSAEAALVCVQAKDAWLRVSEMELARAQKARIKPVLMKRGFFDDLPHAKVIGLNFSTVPIGASRRLRKKTKARFVDVSKIIQELRSTKTEEEISRIAKACRVGDNVYEEILADDFDDEAELKAEIVEKIYEQGCVPSFEPIVASGWHGRLPHYEGSGKLLNGPCILDFGVRHKGYCSDMTRTAFVGAVGKKEREAYSIVRSVLEESKAMLTPNRKAAEPYLHAKQRLGKHLIHSLGHGIGLEVHEAPRLGGKSKERLKEGMTLAVEPGYYTKGFGIRLEDDVVLGMKTLTKVSLEMAKIRKA